MDNNIFTIKLLDVYLPENAAHEPVKQVGIVMEYMQSDLRTILVTAK